METAVKKRRTKNEIKTAVLWPVRKYERYKQRLP